MALTIKICGLRTPEALDVALESGADLVGFVFFPPSPRNLGLEAARALGVRVQGRAGKVALTVDANDETLLDIVAALKPDMLQLHGTETPERVVAVRTRFGLPVMKALPIAERSDLSPIRLYAKSPTGCCSTRARPRRPPGPAGSASRSTGRCSRTSTPAFPSCSRAGSTPATSRKRCALPARLASTCRPASSASRARRMRTRSAPSFVPRDPPKQPLDLTNAVSGHDRADPTPSAPVPTSAGISASMAAASSPRR